MGQYFKIVNLDKKEFIHPHSINAGAKFWEICANNIARLLPYLLRKSSQTGGGDVDNQSVLRYCGRWACNRIVLIGDYDESGLYAEIRESNGWKNISIAVAKEFNRFIQLEECKIHRYEWEQGKQIAIPF